MKKIFGIFLLFSLGSCSNYVDKPDHLISKDKMSEIIAELSLNEETSIINPNGNLEAGTRFVLKKHQIKAKDFAESYKYYTVTRKLEPILDDAQNMLKDKNPEAEKYIEKRLKESQGIPPFAK